MTTHYDPELQRFIQKRRRTLRRRRVALVVFVAAVVMNTVGALAYFTGTGSGQNANGTVGSLGAPGKPSTSVVGTSVHLSWSAAQLSNGSTSGVAYHVERRPDPGNTWTDVCSSSAASPISATNCDDSPGPGNYVYSVTAEFNSWTRMGPESDPVTAAIIATKLMFLTSPVTTTAGVTSGTITIERQDAAGQYPGTAGGRDGLPLVQLRNSLVPCTVGDASTITTVSIPAGGSDASFRYEDTAAGTPLLTVTDTPDGLTAGDAERDDHAGRRDDAGGVRVSVLDGRRCRPHVHGDGKGRVREHRHQLRRHGPLLRNANDAAGGACRRTRR